MVIKINPSRIPIWRSPTTLQLGLGQNALVLQDLQPSDEKLVQLLYKGIADGSVGAVASTLGSSRQATGDLLNRLSPALLRESEQASKHQALLSQEFVAQAFSEIIRASFRTDVDGTAVLRNRAMRAIAVQTADKASLVLALALATAGIGAIECTDAELVGIEDLGQLGYEARELGQVRSDALGRKLETGNQPARLVRAVKRNFTLSAKVLIANHVLMPDQYAALMKGSTPHIAIEFGAEQTRVSPLIRPGFTPCLSCRHAEEIARDKDWLAIATQLRFRHERLDDVQSTLLATGIALETLLRFVDDPRDSTFEGKVIDHRTGQISSQTWNIDANCECADLASVFE